MHVDLGKVKKLHCIFCTDAPDKKYAHAEKKYYLLVLTIAFSQYHGIQCYAKGTLKTSIDKAQERSTKNTVEQGEKDMGSKLRINQTKRVTSKQTVVDGDTGEILEQTTTTTERTEEPDYVKLYIDAWVAFSGKHKVNSRLLCELLPYMTYANDEQRIALVPDIKLAVARRLGWSGGEKDLRDRVTRGCAQLVKEGVLKKLGKDYYSVNPELIGRGDWASIRDFRVEFAVIGDDAGTVKTTTTVDTHTR